MNEPFNQDNLIRCHPTYILPLMLRVIPNGHRLSLMIWIDKSNRERVMLGINAPEVT